MAGDLAIIFVCQNARARIFNVAHPLRKNENVRTILFSQVFEYKYQSKAFDNIYLYRDYADLENKIKRLADRYNILAAVGSTEPIRQSRILIDMARKWPVLIDQFDSYWSSFHFAGIDVDRDKKFAHMAEEIKEEKYCFSKAEGVIARTGELPLLFQQEKVPTQTLLCGSIPSSSMTASLKMSGNTRLLWQNSPGGPALPKGADSHRRLGG